MKKYIFKLFIMSDSIRYKKMVEDFEKLLDERLNGNFTLDIIDVNKKPELMEEYNIMAVPTVIREWPKPQLKIIGEFSSGESLLKLNII